MKTLWDMPLGETILLNTEEDAKHLLSKLVISNPEYTELFGFKVKSRQMTQEELDKHCIKYDANYPDDSLIFEIEEHNRVEIAPIFYHNPYFPEEQQTVYYKDRKTSISPENIILDKEIYSSFPCVAYIWIEESYDRGGDSEIMIFNVTPLSEIPTPSYFQEQEDKYIEIWRKRTKELVDFENKREEYLKSKKAKL